MSNNRINGINTVRQEIRGIVCNKQVDFSYDKINCLISLERKI